MDYSKYPWDNNLMMWAQWPKDRSKPTLDEFNKAEARYRLEIKETDERLKINGKWDMSDWRIGLPWVMATYNIALWWDFFFPDEKIDIATGLIEFIATCKEEETLLSRYYNGF
jgi:hypothetical protein